MSRSNPTERTPNPTTRWFEWRGEKGTIRYWNKETKAGVELSIPWTFILLDELSSVKGWHDAAQTYLFSNEVRDTSTDVLVVKVHKGETVAEGTYRNIKDIVRAAGGRFNASLYLAFKDDESGDYRLGNIGFRGAALKAWMEFRQQVGMARYHKAIRIDGFTEGKKGRVTYRMPTFALVDVSELANARALAIDTELQGYLAEYLSRNKRDQAEAAPKGEQDDFAADAVDAADIPF